MIRHKNGNRTSVTMRDVANLAGVSQSTVSRVLNPTSATAVSISEETKQSVFDAVKQLGYYPNLAAQSLRGQKTMLIAMMIADISNPYYHQMVRAVQDVARKRNYDVLIANSDHDSENEQHFIQGIVRRPPDGVIITPYHLTSDDIDGMVERTGVSVVSLGKHMCRDGVDCVYADDEKATYEATRWLIKQRQHKKIAYIAVPGAHPSDRRLRGFRKAMEEARLPVPSNYVETGDFTPEGGEQAMRHLLRLPSPPTAVIACNDLMGLGCLEAAEAAGFEVPNDVAVIGFDNIPETMRVMPKLTTIAQFPKEMGERLATALFERIEGEIVGPARLFEVPCKLLVREST